MPLGGGRDGMRMPQMHSMCTDVHAFTHMFPQSVCMHHKHTNMQTYVNTYNTHTQRTMSVVENDCHVKRPHGDKKSHGRLGTTTHQSLHHKSQLTEPDSSGAARKWAAFFTLSLSLPLPFSFFCSFLSLPLFFPDRISLSCRGWPSPLYFSCCNLSRIPQSGGRFPE